MRRLAAVLSRLSFAAAMAVAWGAPLTVEAQASLPSQDPSGFVGFTSTRMPGHLLLDSSMALGYAFVPLRVRPSTGASVDHQVTADLARLRLGLGGRGALRLALPVVAVSRGQGTQHGMGDAEIGAQVRVWGPAADARGDTPEGAGAQLELIGTVPFGHQATRTVTERGALEGAASFDIQAFGVMGGARLGYAHQFDRSFGELGEDRLKLTIGAQVPALLFGRAFPEQVVEHVLLDLHVESEPQRFLARGRTAVEGRGALRIRIGDWLLSGGVAVGLLRTRETALVRVFGALGLSPRPKDKDLDGVLDGVDGCPQLPEDVDGFEDADGCPEPDNDEDGILDEDDRCPLEPSSWDRDADEDGCND